MKMECLSLFFKRFFPSNLKLSYPYSDLPWFIKITSSFFYTYRFFDIWLICFYYLFSTSWKLLSRQLIFFSKLSNRWSTSLDNNLSASFFIGFYCFSWVYNCLNFSSIADIFFFKLSIYFSFKLSIYGDSFFGYIIDTSVSKKFGIEDWASF